MPRDFSKIKGYAVIRVDQLTGLITLASTANRKALFATKGPATSIYRRLTSGNRSPHVSYEIVELGVKEGIQ